MNITAGIFLSPAQVTLANASGYNVSWKKEMWHMQEHTHILKTFLSVKDSS
jgi:hypothetical protein